ncbi:chromatin associated protein KTI12, partial [Dimargaris cristalligena]
MPLVILAGIPCSGKTRRAEELRVYFQKRLADIPGPERKIHILNDQSLGIAKSAYDASTQEKLARGQLMSAVERLVNRDDIVIADGLNYIKGFRYQMYCVARASRTPHCVIHVAAPAAIASEWNAARPDGYESAMFDNLVSRFEEPEGRNRWDAPLFTVLYSDESAPLDSIWGALFDRKAPPPHLATAVKPVTETNYLYELDKVTQDVLNAFLEAQKEQLVDQIMVPHAESVRLHLPSRTVSLAELRRVRRQFININRMHVLLGSDRIAEQFAEYL